MLQSLGQVQAGGAGTLGQALILQGSGEPFMAPETGLCDSAVARHEIWLSEAQTTEPYPQRISAHAELI